MAFQEPLQRGCCQKQNAEGRPTRSNPHLGHGFPSCLWVPMSSSLKWGSSPDPCPPNLLQRVMVIKYTENRVGAMGPSAVTWKFIIKWGGAIFLVLSGATWPAVSISGSPGCSLLVGATMHRGREHTSHMHEGFLGQSGLEIPVSVRETHSCSAPQTSRLASQHHIQWKVFSQIWANA